MFVAYDTETLQQIPQGVTVFNIKTPLKIQIPLGYCVAHIGLSRPFVQQMLANFLFAPCLA
ncbi:MAG: hypothetical protein CTY26_04870 [Methylophilus sp.]|nr:MAG: hypothetical protein CTY26_04870 [Methylophilus sp.]